MPSQQENNAFICRLEGRCLIKVSGADAITFLQNLITQDVPGLTEGQLAYSCLLTPQGRFLHDFFISRDAEGFFLECETWRREDLIRRLNVFKLRAKVTIEDCHGLFDVYTTTGATGFPDPRLAALGRRFYLPKNKPLTGTISPDAYRNMRIRLGVPEGSPDIKPEIDTLSDVNLDHLHAVSWDKGCYVGQEITARMRNRGLVKKRMMIVSGNHLAAGSVLTQNGYAVGEVRSTDSAATAGLAILKLNVLADNSPITLPNGFIISAHLPNWLELENT